MSKEIPLTQGKVAIVDDADYERVSKHKWVLTKKGYACRTVYLGRENGKTRTTSEALHRVIMNAPKGKQVDHIDRNRLNCRKANLRICTSAENSRNRNKVSWGTSQYKGVRWYEPHGKWLSRIASNNRRIHLGYYTTEREAAEAYDTAARKYHGEYARPNFPLKSDDCDTEQ